MSIQFLPRSFFLAQILLFYYYIATIAKQGSRKKTTFFKNKSKNGGIEKEFLRKKSFFKVKHRLQVQNVGYLEL